MWGLKTSYGLAFERLCWNHPKSYFIRVQTHHRWLENRTLIHCLRDVWKRSVEWSGGRAATYWPLQKHMGEASFKFLQRSWAQILYCNKWTEIEWKQELVQLLSSIILIQKAAELLWYFPATWHGKISGENLTNTIGMNIKAHICLLQVLSTQHPPKISSTNELLDNKFNR